MNINTNSIPDSGQIVEVRQRQWVVLETSSSLIKPLHPQQPPQHVVSLSSIEDEAFGEELQVLWEIEIGTQIREKAALPTPSGFDTPERLDTFLDAVRWGAVASANTSRLQSPFRSGIEIEDYQLDPVVRALAMPRVNLLIADDVGLGKTIEAGLVAQELILRHRARTILIVCPSSIQIQWQEQMRDKFGLEFRIVDSALMKVLRRQRGLHVNPWSHFPRLITSIDFLKRDRPLRQFRETLPTDGEPTFPRRFDLLIVDEAHNVAPPGTGRYATDSQRTLAIRTLAPHFEHKLFLTATPHNGYWESFSSLLELLDNQRFVRSLRPNPTQLQKIMVRRLKRDLPKQWDGSSRFPERQLTPLEIEYTKAEQQVHRQLQAYASLRQENTTNASEKVATEFVLKLLKKRLFSSPAAFMKTLEQHQKTITTPRHKTPLVNKPSLGILQARIEGITEEFADDTVYEETIEELVETASYLHPPDAEEQELLNSLLTYAKSASSRPDAKASALIKWIKDNIRANGEWGDKRVLIFTEYRATQNWLYDLLAAEGLTRDDRLMMLSGGMESDKRERIKAAFQAHPSQAAVRILLATDAASEGVDLQNHCAHLIHYEIPWNPNRIEQRNGRLDRHGQRADKVVIYHFVSQGYQQRFKQQAHFNPGELEGDLEFLMRAVIKVDNIREDLGRVGTVIAEQVEQAMLGKRQQLDTERAEQQSSTIRKRLSFERNLAARLKKLYQQLQNTKQELHLSPVNIQKVVEVGLILAGQPPLQATDSDDVFKLPSLSGSWAHCTKGLAHPHTQKIRPIVFDWELARHRDDVVLVHLNHRLVQMSLHLLRAEVWSSEGRQKLHRVTARLIPSLSLDVPAVIAHARIVVLGGDNHRLHEEIITAGGYLREGRFARIKGVDKIQTLLDAALPTAALQDFQDRLAILWRTHKNNLIKALESRLQERTKNLQKILDEQAQKEVADITAILQELQRDIEAELKTEDIPKLALWTEPEKAQLKRDRSNLKHRLDSIPAEIERETKAIQARYAKAESRLFPVAVTYLVPEKLVSSTTD